MDVAVARVLEVVNAAVLRICRDRPKRASV